jgi:hypothetical protein
MLLKIKTQDGVYGYDAEYTGTYSEIADVLKEYVKADTTGEITFSEDVNARMQYDVTFVEFVHKDKWNAKLVVSVHTTERCIFLDDECTIIDEKENEKTYKIEKY